MKRIHNIYKSSPRLSVIKRIYVGTKYFILFLILSSFSWENQQATLNYDKFREDIIKNFRELIYDLLYLSFW